MKNLMLGGTTVVAFIITGLLIGACKREPSREHVAQVSGNYMEPHRPQFHFSPPAKWMNDPNGMFYYEGEYHLFYQYYPDSTVWGPMHWGHAVSRDLVHWEHLPVALFPDSLGYIFSGSAVVDWKNSSGLGKNGQAPLVAIYTYHNPEGERAGRNDFQYQGIAYSNDRGRTWTKYPGNPVIPNTDNIDDFRDPKVIWDENSQQWVMVFAAYDHVKFWGSSDLIHWSHLSDFGKTWGVHGGVWECPDLFPVQVEGTGETKWVLLLSINPGSPNGGSGTQYFVGHFNGKAFELDPAFAPSVSGERAVWLDYGRDNYAGVTWSDIPKADGRRLFIGWMSNWDYAQAVPTAVWRSAMTLPRELTLRQTSAGYRIFLQPVRELRAIRQDTVEIQRMDVAGQLDISAQAVTSPAQMEMVLEFEYAAGLQPDFGIEISNTKGERYRVGFNAATDMYYSDRTQAGDVSFSNTFAPTVHNAPRLGTGRTVKMHLFFDAASAELFADDGATSMTDIFFPSETFNRISLYAVNGGVRLLRGSAFPLQRIWR